MAYHSTENIVLLTFMEAFDLWKRVEVYAVNLEDGTERLVQDNDDLAFDLFYIHYDEAKKANLIFNEHKQDV